MAMDASRLGAAMVQAMKDAGVTFDSVAQETDTTTSMTALAEAIIEEITDHAELNSTATSTEGVID